MKETRKRPLLTRSNNKVAPPVTASTKLLEQLIDGSSRTKQKKKTKRLATHPPASALSTLRTTSLLGAATKSSSSSSSKPKNVLAFRGGLASVQIPPPRASSTGPTTTTTGSSSSSSSASSLLQSKSKLNTKSKKKKHISNNPRLGRAVATTTTTTNHSKSSSTIVTRRGLVKEYSSVAEPSTGFTESIMPLVTPQRSLPLSSTQTSRIDAISTADDSNDKEPTASFVSPVENRQERGHQVVPLLDQLVPVGSPTRRNADTLGSLERNREGTTTFQRLHSGMDGSAERTPKTALSAGSWSALAPPTTRPPASLRVGLTLGKKKPAPRSMGLPNRRRPLAEATTPDTDTTTVDESESSVLALPPPSSSSFTTHTNKADSADFSDTAHSLLSAASSSAAVIPSASASAATKSTSNTFAASGFASSLSSSFSSKTTDLSSKRRKINNDNFVRTNLRNTAGACRGARNKKRQSKWRNNKFSRYDNNGQHDRRPFAATEQDEIDADEEATKDPYRVKFAKSQSGAQGQAYVSRMTGLDPVDDYLDGVFGNATSKVESTAPNTATKSSEGTKEVEPSKTASKPTGTKEKDDGAPKCARHQRPCKLIIVKKNTTGNKGRKFYACSLPRGEQCDHFQWADDTVEAARRALTKNTSHSSFVARQVAAHVDRFKVLTVPELRDEAVRRKLEKDGKKSQLLMRLALWARDEIVKAAPDPEEEGTSDSKSGSTVEIDLEEDGDDDEEDVDSDEDSASSEELELFDDDDNDDNDHMKEHVTDRLESPMDGDNNSGSNLLSTLQTIFGHSGFREGQEWAIERCMAGKKSLLVAPTGFGKSLCYALPAALMDGVCVVVSPLISLIQDQLRSLPPRVPAATLSGSITAAATAAILDDVNRKRIKILFVSPERLTSPSFRRLFNLRWNSEKKQYERKFPDISLLCIDEAHCVSQWAHNFRPCFLRFQSLLRIMKPQSLLAVTATAGPRVIQDISTTLGIEAISGSSPNDVSSDDQNILVIDKTRDNIDVVCKYVADHEERLDMISKILKPKTGKRSDDSSYSGALADGAVIVYVWRQRDTEVVAENLIASGVSGGVVMYHGGMDSSSRSRSQSKFMRGKARICVATVAFGMGIDKADVVGIIHMYLSSSPEHYLQEIGRAGRDGRPARAIALPTIDEVPIRHSLAHSNTISESQIRALLGAMRKLIVENSVDGEMRSLHLALPVESLVLECDCKAETIETLLSIMEQNGRDQALLHVEGYNYDSATIALKRRSLKNLSEKEEIAACILKVSTCCDSQSGTSESREDQAYRSKESFQKQFLAYSKGSYAFSVAKCANALGPSAEPRHVFAALRRLQSSGELELALDTTSKGRVFHVKLTTHGASFFNSSAFNVLAGTLTTQLHETFSSSISSGASKVLSINYVMDAISTASQENQTELKRSPAEKSPGLERFQELASLYFSRGLDEETNEASRRILPDTFFKVRTRELENDVYALLRDLPVLVKQPPESEYAPIFGDSTFRDYTAIATTKFLHGLDSPRAPMQAFRTHPMFGKWKEVHFSCLLEATGKLLKTPTN